MKKIIFLFAMMAVVLFTSCKDDEPVNKESTSTTMYYRSIAGDEVAFSHGETQVEFNYTDGTIQITTQYKDLDGQSRTLTTPAMKMTARANTPSIVDFKETASSTRIDIDNLQGSIDLNTGMMYLSFTVDGTTQVVGTTILVYAYTTTTIIDPDKGDSHSHQLSSYSFAIDSKGETGRMQITDFYPNITGTAHLQSIIFEDLEVTPTTTGYRITAHEATSQQGNSYTVTNVDFTLDDQCRIIDGSFECKGIKFKVTGNIFPSANGQ